MKEIKTYIPVDNSYQQCLDDNGRNHYLAGTLYEPKSTELQVIIQPFQMNVMSTVSSKTYLHTFIIGIDPSTKLRHLVVYNNK